MKSDKFLSAIGNIDDDFIEEAAQFKTQAQKPRRKLWLRYGSLAACLLVAVFTCVHFWPAAEPTPRMGPDRQGTALNLPKLTIDTNHSATEIIKKAADVSLRDDGSPWSEDLKVKEMPVYRNTMYGAAERESVPAAEEKLKDQVEIVAASLEAQIQDISYGKETAESDDANGTAGATFYKATAATDQGEISVTSDYYTVVEFSPSIELPEEYRVLPSEMDKEKAEAVADYLLKKFGGLMSFQNPKQSTSAVYDEMGSLKWIIKGYDDSGDAKDEIINYSMKQMIFQADDLGNLKSIILKDNLAGSKKIDSYPIITSSDAEKLLKKGNYITFGENPLPDIEQIENVNLVYLAGGSYETFLPYYSFDIRSQDIHSETSGLAQYATYYVPAVKGEYISNMPNAAE